MRVRAIKRSAHALSRSNRHPLAARGINGIMLLCSSGMALKLMLLGVPGKPGRLDT